MQRHLIARLKNAYTGTALVMTLMFIVLLSMEVAMITFLVVHSAGEQGMLRGQNIAARRAAEVALRNLESEIYADVQVGMTPTQAYAKYRRGGTAVFGTGTGQSPVMFTLHDMAAVDPGSGGTDAVSGIQIAAWIQEVRGNYFHLVGQATYGSVSLLGHKWAFLNPCISTTSASLTTIVSGIDYPGINSNAVDSTGRIYFAQKDTIGANLWTWKNGILTTIISGYDKIANGAIVVGPDDRVFIGQHGTGPFWTYQNNVLSTIINSIVDPGFDQDLTTNDAGQMAVDPGGRVYFAGGAGGMFTWKNNSLSTIGTIGTIPPYGITSKSADIVYFGAGTKFYRWSPSSGLSTANITVCGTCDGVLGVSVYPENDQAFFGDRFLSGAHYWTWKANTLSTIMTTANGAGPYGGNALSRAYHVFSDWNNVRAWSPAQGLSTFSINGNESFALTAGNRAYWGSDNTSTNFWTWSPSTGLTTILSARPYPGSGNLVNQPILVGERIYFSEGYTNGNVYTYDVSTGLSTIATGLNYPGLKIDDLMREPSSLGIGVDPNGWVIFSEQGASAGRVWKQGVGLSTIVAGRTSVGVESIQSSPAGGFYFGEYTTAGNFYYWNPSGATSNNCSTRGY